MKEKGKHRIAPHPAAFSFTLALLLVMTALFASSCGESSKTHSLKATISAQATQLAEVAPPTVTSLASPTPPKAAGLASPTPPPPAAKSHAPLIPIWSVSISNLEIGYGKLPFVIGDVIVASTPEGYTMGLSRATGEVLWTWELTDPVFAKDGMRLYMRKGNLGNQPTPRIYALDLSTGKRVWNIDIDTKEAPLLHHLGSPYVELCDGLLYVVRGGPRYGSPTEIVAIDTSTGEERWVQPEAASVEECLGGVLLTSTGGQIVGLAPETGEIVWGPIDPGIVPMGGSDSRLASDEIIILQGLTREHLQTWTVALDPKTGSQKWTLRGGGRLIAFGNTLLCLTSLPEGLGVGGCIDRFKGELKWTWERDALGMPIGMAGDALVFSSESRELIYGVDIETGSKLWDMDLQASHYWGGASDGVAIILNPVGIYGVDAASGRRIWEIKREVTSYGSSSTTFEMTTDFGPIVRSRTEEGTIIDLLDPATGEIKWRQQVPSFRSIIDADDLVLIISGSGNGPFTLSAYEKAR